MIMFNQLHSLTLAVACGVLAVFVVRPLAADVVVFDISDGQFVWLPWTSDADGNLFDATLGPTAQADADPSISYTYYGPQGGGGSGWVQSMEIVAADGAAIASETDPVIVHWYGGDAYLYLATRFYTPIGPDANWSPRADVAWYSTKLGMHRLLGEMFTAGIRLNLADGPHYGFIRFAWTSSHLMYQPVEWGYETDPNTPLMICEIDFNADGVVNSQDFFDFLVLFFAADPLADFDHTGTVNSQDFFAYLDSFFVGC
jgi:hypothetical protein